MFNMKARAVVVQSPQKKGFCLTHKLLVYHVIRLSLKNLNALLNMSFTVMQENKRYNRRRYNSNKNKISIKLSQAGD